MSIIAEKGRNLIFIAYRDECRLEQEPFLEPNAPGIQKMIYDRIADSIKKRR